MKILKQGNYKPTEYLFKCERCGCVFTEEENNSYMNAFYKNTLSVSCYCPCCECSCTSDTIYTEEKDGDENG